jgi:hypothetical protein
MTNLQFYKQLDKLRSIKYNVGRIEPESERRIHIIDDWIYYSFTDGYMLGIIDSDDEFKFMFTAVIYNKFLSESNKGLRNKAKFIRMLKETKLYFDMRFL